MRQSVSNPCYDRDHESCGLSAPDGAPCACPCHSVNHDDYVHAATPIASADVTPGSIWDTQPIEQLQARYGLCRKLELAVEAAYKAGVLPSAYRDQARTLTDHAHARLSARRVTLAIKANPGAAGAAARQEWAQFWQECMERHPEPFTTAPVAAPAALAATSSDPDNSPLDHPPCALCNGHGCGHCQYTGWR